MNKKNLIFICGLVSLLSVFSIGCENGLDLNSNVTSDTARTSTVAKRIGELKDAGLLDSLLQEKDSRTVGDTNLGDIDKDKLDYFLSHTDEALAEISESNNGDAQLRLIDALFNGGTVGEIVDSMALISEDMAAGYLNAVETQYAALNDILEQDSAARSVSAAINIRNIRLQYYNVPNNSSRGAYASNFNTDTIIWYTGFCAATVAGIYAANSWMPWVSIPGAIAAVAGGASMIIQLKTWYNCSEFKKFCNDLISLGKTYNANKDYDATANASYAYAVNSHFKGTLGAKLAGIGCLTGVTVAACAISPIGRKAIIFAKEAYNAMSALIKSLIPPWIAINGNGIYIIISL
jgi:hypothetical protein